MNNKYKFLNLLILIFIVNLSISNVYPQTDPNERPIIQQPTRFIKPLAWTEEPYGIDNFLDVVVSVGPFDNYDITIFQCFAETDIAVNPTNPLNFVGGDNRAILAINPILVTTDGGVSWNYASINTITQGDPVFCYDNAGNAYYAVLQNGVRIYKSVNGGLTWTNLGNAYSSSATDKEWIAADQTTGPFSNYVYASWSDFSAPVTIRFVRSTDGGTTWSFSIVLYGPANAQGSNIAVGPNGRVYVAWYGNGTVLKYSIDGGASFSSEISVASYTEPGVTHSSGRKVLKGDIRVNGFPQLACDMTNGPNSGNIYCQYAANPPGPDNADVYLVRSTNGGVNWSEPMRVNNDSTFFDQWMGDVSVDNLGRVWVMWWDSRNDPNNMLTETYAAVSTDGGLTFSQNIKVSNQPFNPSIVKINQGNHYYLGDYQGMSGKTITFPLWTDGRFNIIDNFVAYLPDFGISFSKDVDSVGPGQTSVNRVRVPLMGPYSGTITFTPSVTPTPSQGTITFNWVPSNIITINGVPDSLTLNTIVSSDVPLQTYTITVTGAESSGPRTHTRSWSLVVRTPIGISSNQNEIPAQYKLEQNYPNPFNPKTIINFQLPMSNYVKLIVYNILGEEAAALVNQELKAGSYTFDWDAGSFPSGIYYYKLTAGDFTDVKKMVLVK